MKYTFRPYHITASIAAAIVLFYLGWAWTTGWECGFLSNCHEKYFIQSFIRLMSLIVLVAYFIILSLITDYKKEITISNPFKEKVDPEAQELYQEWLRERDKEQLKKENLDNI